ncbi:MAG: leucine--tRNA ligase [Candidatus Thermoplasmatota archaeon]|nr:leucine--tRNA ligase [Candidatus Thermoplasmatota archaeon]MBU1941267.1 leucine--tRNA ligase [Candidatus Thermoplasmatota archaeon]
MATYEYESVETKWQQRWLQNHINKAEHTTGKKFFIHFAYPGVSGYLHVGHMRGFTYTDIIARYKRMTGYDVMFPAGFHASGIPSVGFAKKVERKDPDTLQLLKQHKLSDTFINTLTDPHNVVDYFSKVYVDEYWKRFGFLIDYERQMTTISPGYQRFIQWQFQKLHTLNLLIQKPHFAPYCPNCGPVAVDKSETDVSSGGSAEILEFTVLKFTLKDGTILPAATLRPETIFGVTNMWINPQVNYQKIKVGEELWICSEECAKKLLYQLENVDILDDHISGKDFEGKTCTVPLINREVPILAGEFADPSIATGIVMSVPAHAPYDWIALVDSGAKITPIKIIDVMGFGDNPAKEACDQLNIKNQKETDKLDEATDLVYKKEFHTGVLNDYCGAYAGIKISDIKDTVKNDLIAGNLATTMREFSEEVICRCKEHVVIKRIPDQWFIKYSDDQLTANSQRYADSMHIYPSEYKEELPGVLDWFDDRAVIRKGSWLGTEFPYKKGWIIEPISDSTLYPAYYIIAPYINSNQLTVEEMTQEFFDYIFLDKGHPKNQIWKTIHDDFAYWYPVDINLGGKEHKTVHFPVYIMNHVAIMPPEKCPQGLFVHWWVTQQGKEKISKSKGGAEPILEAAHTYGVDAMRLYYTHVGSPFVDIEWDTETVLKYKNRVGILWRLFQEIKHIQPHENQNLDRWLQSSINNHIQIITTAFESYDLRMAANTIFFELPKDLQWYLRRGGGNTNLVADIGKKIIRLITPITPHLAEEVWEQYGETTFVSNASYPLYDSVISYKTEEVGEYLLAGVINDINEILKVTKITPTHLYIYIAPEWKQSVFQEAIRQAQKGSVNVAALIKQSMADPELKKLGKEIAQFVGKLPGEVRRLNETDQQRYLTHIDEKTYLSTAVDYLTTLFSCEIHICGADDTNLYDPVIKVRFALPLRPAIYIE